MLAPLIRALLVTALAAAALTGCGGADSSSGTPSSPSDTPSPPPRASDPEADAAITRSALLRLSDLPVGWTASADTSPNPHCPATDAVERNPNAESDRFKGNGEEYAQHEVIVLATAEEADSALDAILERDTLDCLAQQTEALLGQQAPAGTTVGDVSADELNVLASGDRALGARIVVPWSRNGFGAEIYEDLVISRVGRGLSLVAVIAEGGEPDATLRADLARRGAQLLRRALAAG